MGGLHLSAFGRCLPLLREYSKRDELLEMSIEAGDSARARGAHEVCGSVHRSGYQTFIERTSSSRFNRT